MRTLVQGGWIVGCDGSSHHWLRDGTLAFEDESDSGGGIDTVIVEGQTLTESRRARVLAESALLEAAQESGEATWATVPDWQSNQATVDELSPMSYTVASE